MTDQKPTRAETIRTERRRKPGATVLSGLKLGIPEEMLDRSNFEYRWANDKGNRVAQLTADDWDAVSEPVKADSDGSGSVQTKIVGTDGGKPVSAILMKKRKDWYLADRKESQKPLDETDEAIRRGVNHQKDSPELSGGVGYTPGGQNTVSRA